MPDEPSASSGQEPTPSTPQAGTPSTSGQAPDGGNKPSMSLEDALAALKAAREEAASHRVSNKELASKLKTFEDAQLSEAERKDKAFGELQQTHSQLQESYQRLLVHNAVLEAAPGLGINGKLAARLIDWSGLKIDDEGHVAKLDDALKALLAEFPELAVAQPPSQSQTMQQRQQVPTSNPQRSGSNGYTGVNPRNISWNDAFRKQ